MSHFYKHEDAKVVVLDQADVDFHINGTYADEGMEERDDTETFGSRICAEDMAMLGALYSRSDLGAMGNIMTVKKRGSGSFMETYYVGYGHGSIGKMGNVFLSFEGVSMLFAKELQDDGLYVGQETSTRYMNFLTRGYVTYANRSDLEEHKFFARQYDIYKVALELKVAELKEKYPFVEGEQTERFYENAINARAFDTCRSLLPCGSRTLVCIYGSIETVKRVLNRMIGYGAKWPEVSTHAMTAYKRLQERYPHSFEELDMAVLSARTEKMVETRELLKEKMLYGRSVNTVTFTGDSAETNYLIERVAETYGERVAKEPLPPVLAIMGQVQMTARVDFGGWRDIQRHRNGHSFAEIPHFNQHAEFYQKSLPAEILASSNDTCKRAEQFYRDITSFMSLDGELALEQAYCVPMGHEVNIITSFPLDNAVYVAELRSGYTVHPTVRAWAIELGTGLKNLFPALKLFVNWDPYTKFSIKRGSQTIEEKK